MHRTNRAATTTTIALFSLAPLSMTMASASASPAAASTLALAPSAPRDDTQEPVEMRAELAIDAVTLYRSRAAVTRSGAVDLNQGLYQLRVGPLPETADLDSVRARVGAGAKLLDVRTETVALPAPTSDNPRVREVLAAIEAAKARIADLARKTANNLAAQKTIDSIAAKAAGDASQALGGAMEPVKLRAQLEFIEAERERLTSAALALADDSRKAAAELQTLEGRLAEAGGAPPAQRFALVSVAVPTGGKIEMHVTYLVARAGWQPAYAVRGEPDAGTLALEFDAVVKQSTGEDWKDVAMVLSTAQPTQAANPSPIEPLYLSLYEPQPVETSRGPGGVGGGGGGFAGGRFGAPAPTTGAAYDAEMADAPMSKMEFAAKAASLENLGRDASIGGEGPAVEYRLPRSFTAPSDAAGERRTRVATIDAKPTYALVARPLVESDVYLRARFRNESGYLLLAGDARMYLGADSIGRTQLAETPVGGEVELWFGKEPRVTVVREVLSKSQSESGVFSKATEINRAYRISLVNTLTRAVDVEVWDRMPVSQNAEAKVELREVSPAVATDENYTRDEKPQGILKWTLTLPARAADAIAKPASIGWKTRISWPREKILEGDED